MNKQLAAQSRRSFRLWRSVGSAYKLISYAFFGTCLVLVLINLAAALLLSVLPEARKINPVVKRYGRRLEQVYPGLKWAEINQMLAESWQPYDYEPYSLIKERPRRGRYVNVSPDGFRHVRDQGPWPPVPGTYTIFMFGGSTAFGYSVPDDQTVASQLQDVLNRRGLKQRVHVYNFGRGFYYSSQERVLFSNLLVAGHRPDMAIFLDGLNDAYYVNDEPHFSPQFRAYLAGIMQKVPSLVRDLSRKLPIIQLKERLRSFVRQEPAIPDMPARPWDERIYGKPEILTTILTRYLINKRLIESSCSAYGIVPVFVWQPVPTYHFDPQRNPFFSSIVTDHYRSRYLYLKMAAYIRSHDMGRHFVWLADIQKSRSETLYVDAQHYSGAFARILAEALTQEMIQRGFFSERTKAPSAPPAARSQHLKSDQPPDLTPTTDS